MSVDPASTPSKKRRHEDEVGLAIQSGVQDLNKRRNNYLSWDDYFMAVAFLSAQRSKDPSSQVGACIVNDKNRIVGIGYNGMPTGCSDHELPWRRKADNWLDTKYPYVCHAEVNAVMNKISADLKGCRMYVALFPCNECAKIIIQAGIKSVIYMSDKYHDDDKMKASRRLMDMAGVEFRHFKPTNSEIVIDFNSIDPKTGRSLDEMTMESATKQVLENNSPSIPT
ncbi:deoxycytidylate deaminase-like [Anneissia japonica]|uniref:deoxycytidylate deaminase-like n=1 Tax=Anneissia japonica TaxID=1529436 RepID=UPI0014254C1B|nr:deoxycytidylate deaminase-like [Anneissia japonica]